LLFKVTIITLSPKGYSNARKRAGVRFGSFGYHSQKSWDDILSEELNRCPDISGKYEGEGRKLDVRKLALGIYQVHEGKYDDFGVEDSFEISRMLDKFKSGSWNLASLTEVCKIQSEVGQSTERFRAEHLYDFLRDEKKLQGLVVAIDDDKYLLDRIYAWYDHKMNGPLNKHKDSLSSQSDRISLTFNPERRRTQDDVVYLRVQNMSSLVENEDRQCLLAIARLLAEDQMKSSGLQMYDLDARFTRV